MTQLTLSTLPQNASFTDRRKIILEMAEAARMASPLAVEKVALIAVSKGQPEDRIRQALDGGQRLFGENRVQEAMDRWNPIRKQIHDIELHLIGPLQSNKVKEAVATFDAIHTVDRMKIADALATEFMKVGRKIACMIQVNTGEEEQKAGILPHEADKFIEYCRNILELPVNGLMCIPPANENPAPHFALLHEMSKRHGLKRLSMGMSSDFETAVKFGATHIRVGTALFGERKKSQTD